jgi:hypothetical protein
MRILDVDSAAVILWAAAQQHASVWHVLLDRVCRRGHEVQRADEFWQLEPQGGHLLAKQ